ncbi:cysteine biosynthesis protein [Methylosinus sp. C49]|uniref:sulfate transporter family protein n=1 Tax=Methylosinus sp. C49 TaxID=2699395 RepID=UPI001366AB82|nr:sulfate transporter family protein [Methylosinus sp. C49]BBU61108.1 cysteine biosynthesis protein [Methylosinus sp. C49]
MLQDALDAARQIFSPPFRNVLLKSLGLTFVLLALAWTGLDKTALSFLTADNYWLRAVVTFATGAGLVVGLSFLIAPISILVAGFFLDDLADVVEEEIDPHGPRGRPLPAGQAMVMALRFALVSAGVNLVALLLLLVPGVNAIVFVLANAYLFGREYFAFAATRYCSLEEARELTRRHATTLFLAGLFIAGFVAVPGLNLFTPLFGVAFMVRLHKRLTAPAARAEARAR